MREPKNIPNEELETWDTGTYQTGTTRENNSQSGIITALLIAVIFLGGLASALGLMNIRLLSELMQTQDPVLPMAVDSDPGGKELFRDSLGSIPKVPENAALQLQVSPQLQQSIDPADVTVRLAVEDNQNQEKTGEALILSADGFLLTTAHLTDSALSITALLPDGRRVPAALVACDPYSDLAVVYVGEQGLTAAVFSDESTVESGSYRLSEDGVVAFLEDGRVTSIWVLSLDGRTEKMVDGPQLRDIATQLVEKGCVSGRPGIGIQVRAMSHFCREYWGLEHGVEIVSTQVEQLLSGDILLSVNGRNMTSCHQLHGLLQQVQPGDEMTLEIFRAGQVFTVTLPMTVNP